MAAESSGTDPRRPAAAQLAQPEPSPRVVEQGPVPVDVWGAAGAPHVVLVGWVKTKQSVRAPAAEVYTSILFRKRRA